MKFEIEHVVNILGVKYVVLDVEVYNDQEYALMNKINYNDEITDEYYIFFIKNGEVKALADMNVVNTLIPIFQATIKNEIKTKFGSDLS